MAENQLTKQLTQLSEYVKVDGKELTELLKKNVLANCSDAEFAFAIGLCNSYQLNPITNEICFLKFKGGRLIPYVEYDGWVKIANRQAEYDGVEFTENFDLNGNFVSVTCKIYLKGKHPTVLTEYLSECQDLSKEPWKKYPIRMLRNKSFNQAIRTTFGISGIYDLDEAERVIKCAEIIPEQRPALPPPIAKDEKIEPKEETKIETNPEPKKEEPATEIKNTKIKAENLKALIGAKQYIGDISFKAALDKYKVKSLEEVPDDTIAGKIAAECRIIARKARGNKIGTN
jgi:hypothetical protein